MVELTPSDRPALTSPDLSAAEALLALAERTAEMLDAAGANGPDRGGFASAALRSYAEAGRMLLIERARPAEEGAG